MNRRFGVLAFLSWDHPWNNHLFHRPEDLLGVADLLHSAGVGCVRMDFLWSDLEKSPGHFDFERYDRIVETLHARDIDILAVLHYNPSWRPGDWNQAPDVAAYCHYAQTTVAHFKGAVKHWEIWNEPDHPMYWQPQDGLRGYSELLKQASAAIRAEDAAAQIVLGGLAETQGQKLAFLYDTAGRDAFDVVNIHPFVNPLAANPMSDLHAMIKPVRAAMEQAGDHDKPLWITEIGCPGIPPAQTPRGWWLGQSPTEEQQAQWIRRVFSEPFQWPGVERIFWAFLVDTGSHFGNDVDYFGLLRSDFSPKPAWEALASSIRNSRGMAS